MILKKTKNAARNRTAHIVSAITASSASCFRTADLQYRSWSCMQTGRKSGIRRSRRSLRSRRDCESRWSGYDAWFVPSFKGMSAEHPQREGAASAHLLLDIIAHNAQNVNGRHMKKFCAGDCRICIEIGGRSWYNETRVFETACLQQRGDTMAKYDVYDRLFRYHTFEACSMRCITIITSRSTVR